MERTEKSTQEESSELGARIEKISQLVGGKRALAEKADIKESQLYRYINGKNIPSVKVVVDIADAADVDAGWLATGDGPMMRLDAEKERFEPRAKYEMFFDKDLLAAAMLFEDTSDYFERYGEEHLSEEENEHKISKIVQKKAEKIDFLYSLIFFGGFYKRGDSFEQIKEKLIAITPEGRDKKKIEKNRSKPSS